MIKNSKNYWIQISPSIVCVGISNTRLLNIGCIMIKDCWTWSLDDQGSKSLIQNIAKMLSALQFLVTWKFHFQIDFINPLLIYQVILLTATYCKHYFLGRGNTSFHHHDFHPVCSPSTGIFLILCWEFCQTSNWDQQEWSWKDMMFLKNKTWPIPCPSLSYSLLWKLFWWLTQILISLRCPENVLYFCCFPCFIIKLRK